MQFSNQGEPIAPAHFHNVPGLLLAFVVLSVLAHGATLLFDAEPLIPLNEHRFGAMIISTVLTPAKDKPATPPTQPTITEHQLEERISKHQSLAKTPETIKTAKVSDISAPRKTEFKTTPHIGSETEPPKPQNEPSIRPQNKPDTTTTIPTNDIIISTSESLANQLKQQRNYLLGELQNRLNRYLTYPIRALKRGWQGEVMVSFNINAHGQLNNVQLAKSSGYSLLDRSAVTAITKLHYINFPDSMGQLQAMELQLPVRYELYEG